MIAQSAQRRRGNCAAGVKDMESQNAPVFLPIELAMTVAHPAPTLIIWLTFTIGILLAVGGVVFVFIGGIAIKEIPFGGGVGSSSQYCGIGSLAAGSVLVWLAFRRIINTIQRSGSNI